MHTVLLYSLLLMAGLIVSQILAGAGATVIRLLTMFALSFIMIHVGYEFEIDKTGPRQYAWDYLVAGTAAAFPWVFCALYFVFVMSPRETWASLDSWTAALLQARFSSPTSAGVLVVSLSYGLAGPALTVAVLSLALNLLCTGLFIIVVKKLLNTVPAVNSSRA